MDLYNERNPIVSTHIITFKVRKEGGISGSFDGDPMTEEVAKKIALLMSRIKDQA